VVKAKEGQDSLKILRRFQFSSQLKRMSSVASLQIEGSKKLFVAAKGAPETLFQLMDPNSRPATETYEELYRSFARKGSRVIALGYKILSESKEVSSSVLKLYAFDFHVCLLLRRSFFLQINKVTRDEVESGLIFAGFLVFHCPLKPDSAEAIRMLNNSSHRVRCPRLEIRLFIFWPRTDGILVMEIDGDDYRRQCAHRMPCRQGGWHYQ
jgi:cation-transporting ATPase 13A1